MLALSYQNNKSLNSQDYVHSWGDQAGMDTLIKNIGDAQFVLLGEASHGTHEYYLWRSRISQRLITEKGFSFIAVEGDWPDCYSVNRYIKNYPNSGKDAKSVLHAFNRWPTWMWANQEIVQLTEWLRDHNKNLKNKDKVGFYGLDVYSLWDSIKAVIEYLDRNDPDAAKVAKKAYQCFEPYSNSTDRYAYQSTFMSKTCEAEVIEILRLLKEKTTEYKDDFEASFDAEQNARVIVNAEYYYRTMLRGDVSSWNIRDNHMVEILGNLMKRYGKNTKAIIWAHNTHVGDARYTDMRNVGMVNIGQLIREAYGENNVSITGFGSYRGDVIAGRYWDAPIEIMKIPEAQTDSLEYYLHNISLNDKLIISKNIKHPNELNTVIGHRAIGVVYNPDHERSNYVPTLLPDRYDNFIFIDKTKALRPLHLKTVGDKDYPETFPWGE